MEFPFRENPAEQDAVPENAKAQRIFSAFWRAREYLVVEAMVESILDDLG